MHHGGSRWYDISEALDDVIRILPFQAVKECGIPIKMVKIFEQRVPVRLGQVRVRVRLELRDRGRDFDSGLLIADRRLDRRMIRSDESIDRGRLMLLDAHQLRPCRPAS
jgi:hypothetical protein